MAKLQLNKSSLAQESQSLRNYERFLPSLDLKRQQLMAERAKAVRALSRTRDEIGTLTRRVGRSLPMIANEDVALTGLVRISDVRLSTENLVGTHLPRLEVVEVEVKSYALLAKPHWVDNVVAALREVLELHVRVQVDERRLAVLDGAVKTITQRVNLFDKVLIPNARANIKRIKVFLSDEEMAAVVRSKIAKRKHSAAGAV